MDIQPVSGTVNTQTAAAQTTGPTTDFETFLTLLTTQLRNQDPLKPLESTDFVAQLATFSGVEQQIASNAKLDTLVNTLRAGEANAVASWIGKEAEVSASTPYIGMPLTPRFDTPLNADLRFVVRDAMGDIAHSSPYTSAIWDGRLADSTQAIDGSYSFELRSGGDADQLVEQGKIYARISEARFAPEGTTLVLEGGEQVQFSQISALR